MEHRPADIRVCIPIIDQPRHQPVQRFVSAVAHLLQKLTDFAGCHVSNDASVQSATEDVPIFAPRPLVAGQGLGAETC